jgi:hypothetical protein
MAESQRPPTTGAQVIWKQSDPNSDYTETCEHWCAVVQYRQLMYHPLYMRDSVEGIGL